MKSNVLAVVALAAAVVLVSTAGRAQTPGGSSAEARQHFERGVQAAEEARWQDAIRELQAARDIRPTPSVHYNLGMAYRAVGRNREAITAFEQYNASAGPSGRAREVNAMIAALRAGLGHVVVRLEPASATLTIDGAAVPPGEGPYEVDPGSHVLVAEATGYRATTRSITVAPGARTEVRLRLDSGSGAARIHIESNVSDATIAIDGRDVSSGTADEFVTPGSHTVAVRARGYGTFRRELVAVTGGSVRIRAVLSDQRSVFVRPVFWVVVVGVVAGAVVAGILIDRAVTAERPFEGPLGHVSDALVRW
jgi:hypothetical protein